MVKNPPSNAVDTGPIPGQGTKISHAMGQLSPCSAMKNPPAGTAKIKIDKIIK